MDIIGVSYAGKPISNTVMYITKKVEYLVDNLAIVEGCKVFVEGNVKIPAEIAVRHEFVITSNPQREYALFVNEMAKKRMEYEQTRKYTLTDSLCYVGENVSIGDNVIMEPGCVIGHDVIIGNNAHIKSGASIKNAIIGDNFIACENCAIGTNGFTMADDEDGNKIRIPTLGKVVIGNNVEVNSCANISCGSAGNTTIGDYVKIDSLVHIGHDVTIERNVEIPAGAIVGGFDVLKEGSYVGINATLRNRIVLGKNAFVGMGAVVTKSVDDDLTVVGNPARPFERKG